MSVVTTINKTSLTFDVHKKKKKKKKKKKDLKIYLDENSGDYKFTEV